MKLQHELELLVRSARARHRASASRTRGGSHEQVAWQLSAPAAGGSVLRDDQDGQFRRRRGPPGGRAVQRPFEVLGLTAVLPFLNAAAW
jgi:hypothetical protein